MSAARGPIPRRLQDNVVTALRGGVPAAGDEAEAIGRAFRRYECGGWLHDRWRSGAPAAVPEAWLVSAAAAHRKTLIDGLAALGALREVAAIIGSDGSPFILLKGAAYLADLYTDAGARVLTDVDLVVPPDRAATVARRLAAAGFQGFAEPDFAEYRRFEMYRPGAASCRFEIHWRVGYGGRMRFDQEAVWRRARPVTLDGIACSVLAPEDALLFHVGHAADHYFGPTLKWALDLALMLRTWPLDPAAIAAGARAAGVMTALHLALDQVEALFPGVAPPDLVRATRIGRLRRAAIGWARADGGAEFFRLGPRDRPRLTIRPFLFDSARAAAAVGATVLCRPIRRLRRRLGASARLPWEPGAVLD